MNYLLTWCHSTPQEDFAAPDPDISYEGRPSLTATSSESQYNFGTVEDGEDLRHISSNAAPTHPTTLSANPGCLLGGQSSRVADLNFVKESLGM